MKRHSRTGTARAGSDALAMHGDRRRVAHRPRSIEERHDFHFSRIGPRGVPSSRPLLEKIAKAMAWMIGAEDGNHPAIPAGITLLGQFIDHDLTFDRHLLGPSADSIGKTLKGRAPALDLDSIYGYRKLAPCGMRLCEEQAYRKLSAGIACEEEAEDGELALARLHLSFIRFHNRLVDRLESDGIAAGDIFEIARDQVTRHYQQALRTRFLPRIVHGSVLDDVFSRGRSFLDRPIGVRRSPTSDTMQVLPGDRMAIPVEFSVAAYGLGYSLMRAASLWRRREMPLETRWTETPDHAPAFHNLVRANLLELASGQQMADLFGVEQLTAREILEGRHGVDLGRLSAGDQLSDAQRSELIRNTPLWFYVLREAELNDGLLGAVGGRIVAEVFHRAMEVSRYSILRPDNGLAPDTSALLND